MLNHEITILKSLALCSSRDGRLHTEREGISWFLLHQLILVYLLFTLFIHCINSHMPLFHGFLVLCDSVVSFMSEVWNVLKEVCGILVAFEPYRYTWEWMLFFWVISHGRKIKECAVLIYFFTHMGGVSGICKMKHTYQAEFSHVISKGRPKHIQRP